MLSCLLGAACAEAPAVRSRWNFQPRANVVHTAVEAIHGPTDDTVPLPPCAARSCNREDMSARTIDVKLQFDRFNGVAGPACRIFRRNLLQCGGRANLMLICESSVLTSISSAPDAMSKPSHPQYFRIKEHTSINLCAASARPQPWRSSSVQCRARAS